MRSNLLTYAITAALAAGMTAAAFADDSQILRRQISSTPGETQNPEPEGEHAFIQMMNFHVPSQASSGDLVPIEYYNIDDALVKTEEKAKPLISVYVYGPVIGFDDFSQSGFPGHGKRDAFGAVSLDDGETWKVTNLSNSADQSSITVTDPVPDAADPACHEDPEGTECTQLTDYPGDVTNIFHSVAGNKVIAAWQSKFCSSGFPGYNGGSTSDAELVAGEIGIDNTADMYLTDLFGVAGNQETVDYKEQADKDNPTQYDGVGEVPYNCLWAARGVLRENPDAEGTSELVWLQAERLTSGRRDVNRIETSCVAGAGCAISWQEDPEGLRPGEGEGAGTGWAGATTNSQTDIWYSFIEWEDFDVVVDGNNEFVPLADLSLGDQGLGTGRPQPAIPMMVPARLTNNARCQTDATEGYCASDVAAAYGLKDQCIGTVSIQLGGGGGGNQEICVVDANGSGTLDTGDLPNIANTAASRPRLNLQPRDSDGDGVTDDAWVIIIHEEDKGLGRFGFLTDEPYTNETTYATSCTNPDDDPLDNCERADIGKNQWYISFALGTPQTSTSEEGFGMVDNLVAQQNMYNAPEVNWVTGTFYPPMNTADMWDFGDTLNYSIFNTEIARRASLMSQSLAKAATGDSGLMAMPLFKEGTINQGGPADIMARRVRVEKLNANRLTWQIGGTGKPVNETEANPFDFANLACEWYTGEGSGQQDVTEGTWLYTDGSNPYYPKGLCTAPTINLSARTPLTCEQSGDSDGNCPGAADMVCVDDAQFGQLCSSTTDPENNQTLDKLLTWYECPGSIGSSLGTGATMPPCYQEPDSMLLGANLDDRSWYMPIDISKAHRGFLDGDFVFMIYAWSPNFKLNAEGKDRYELYTRRSFDGGASWTTTPTRFTASDGLVYSGEGTTTCETWRDGADSTLDSHVCTPYEAGAPEQSRNVTQHKSMKVTTLDPRYTPTIASMSASLLDGYAGDWAIFEPIDPTDLRDPSRNFVVFETGDNTTVAVGEAEPLNLDYGRAEVFGDYFTVWTEIDTDYATVDECYPNNPHDDESVIWAEGTGFCNEFDSLEGFPDALSEEASITSSAYGDFLYGTWGQFNVDDAGEFVDGDVIFRRVWYLDDYISETEAYDVGGSEGQTP